MVRFETIGMFLSIVRFEEIRFVWFTVRLFPARSNAVMLKSTWPSAWVAFTVTLVCYHASNQIHCTCGFANICAREIFVYPVIVMFRASPKVASEVLWGLLLYIVRFERWI